jgi:hypothetical protein
MDKYTWTADETFTARAEVAHYGAAALAGTEPEWSLADANGRELARGQLPKADIPQGTLFPLGQLRIPLAQCPTPQKLVLTLCLPGTPYANSYPLWVYPAKIDVAPPPGVIVSRKFDATVKAQLAAGASVVLLPEPGQLAGSVGGGFATDFWCWPMFKNTPGTMGLLCDPRHPALARFPTESHSNWQWFHLATAAAPIILDATPADFRPVVQVVDNFARNHKLGLVFEARVGSGKLLVCAADLAGMPDRPEARQLLASLLAYAGSSEFRPGRELSLETLSQVLAPIKVHPALRKPATASSFQSWMATITPDGVRPTTNRDNPGRLTSRSRRN